MICQCPKPVQSLNRVRYGEMCLKCGKQVAGDWVADDDTMSEWFDRLAEGMGLELDLDPGHPFEFFRRQCLARERSGREKFRLQYLNRDNPLDGMEEAADLANYSAFGEFVRDRSGRGPSVHLKMAAMFAAKAYECLMRERQEAAGWPLAAMDE